MAKLIRDKIPEIINNDSKKCQVEILSDIEYKKALKAKLLEEAEEVLDASEDKLVEEIADVYEVIDALIKTYGLDYDQIREIKNKKAELKGKFDKKIKLISVANKIENQENNAQLKEEKILKEAEKILTEKIAPQADVLDRDTAKLKEAFITMNDINPNFFRLKLGKEWGGLNINQVSFASWQIMMAKYSGALSFLQTQHQSAVAMLSHSQEETVKQKYLPKLSNENLFFGVGFSHLRKQGKPLVTALPTETGYKITGFVPWITGYDIFSYFILGASLPTGEELYAVVPFQSQSPNLEFSQPLSLSAMNSTNTVSATLNEYFLPFEDMVMIRPPQEIHRKSKQNVLHHGFFPLGCSYGGLKILQDNYQELKLPEVEEVYQSLKSQVDNLQDKMLRALSDNSSFAEKLTLRTNAIDLAYRCAIAAVISSKGKANYNSHPANRLYRETLLYSVSGQTLSVLSKSLQNLV